MRDLISLRKQDRSRQKSANKDDDRLGYASQSKQIHTSSSGARCSSEGMVRIERALALSPVADISNRAPPSNFPFISADVALRLPSVLRQPLCSPHDSPGPHQSISLNAHGPPAMYWPIPQYASKYLSDPPKD
jgi:hypothetical protein